MKSIERIYADEVEGLEEELKDNMEIGGLYKAYDYERMILHKYGFDPDEDGNPENDNVLAFNFD